METKECESCGKEMYAIREVEVMEGIVLVVYRCSFCSEEAGNDDFE